MRASKAIILLLFIGLTACKDRKQPETDNSTDNTKQEFLEKGRTVKNEAFALLSGKLQQEVKANGFASAISFCKINALPLTDSAGNKFNAHVQRLALQNRNPQNALSSGLDKQMYHLFENGFTGDTLVKEQNNPVYYAPIHTAALCLNCHGEQGQNLNPEAEKKIQALYPADKAIGFKEGDLRGIWKITFPATP